MRLKLKLAHIALLLVGALLTVELVFLGVLTSLLHQAERDASAADHARAITSCTDRFFQKFIQAGGMLVLYGTTHNPTAGKQLDSLLSGIRLEVAKMKELTANEPERRAIVEDAEPLIERLIRVLKDAKAGQERGDLFSVIGTIDVKQEFFSMLEQLKKQLATLEAQVRQMDETKPQQYARSRAIVVQFLAAGVALSIAAALAVVIVFTRGISRRIDLLVDNTVRFSHGQPLHPPLRAVDEIGHLDGAIHDMATSLMEAEKMKRQFVSMISHDLRSPLSSIRVSLELLSAGVLGQLSDEGMKIVQNTDKEISRLIGLINELLELEELQTAKFKLTLATTSVSAIVDQSVQAVKSLADKHDLRLDREINDVEFVADSGRLVQVIVNLLANAIKFSPDHSTIMISNEVFDEFIEIRIKDQGRGIPDEFRENIFDPFRQVKKTDGTQLGGSGLGLAICKTIVQDHGGTIGVDSSPGQGSTFWFRISRQLKASS